MSQINRTPADGGDRGSGSGSSGSELNPPDNAGRSKKQPPIATIATGYASQVRISISTWRDRTKLEIKPYSATIPQVYMPSGVGIALPIAKLRELIEALKAAEIEAIGRGLLHDGRAA